MIQIIDIVLTLHNDCIKPKILGFEHVCIREADGWADKEADRLRCICVELTSSSQLKGKIEQTRQH